MRLQQKKLVRNCGTYTTSTWSQSNSSSGGAVNQSNSMNLSQRSLLTTDEVLRIERPYLLVMLAGMSPTMNYGPDLHLWYFNKVLGLGDPKWNIGVRELREIERPERKTEPIVLWNIAEITKMEKEKQQQEEMLRKMEEKRTRYMMQRFDNEF